MSEKSAARVLMDTNAKPRRLKAGKRSYVVKPPPMTPPIPNGFWT
jgi:hypothetical protein